MGGVVGRGLVENAATAARQKVAATTTYSAAIGAAAVGCGVNPQQQQDFDARTLVCHFVAAGLPLAGPDNPTRMGRDVRVVELDFA